MSRNGEMRSTTRWQSSTSTAKLRPSPAAKWATSPGSFPIASGTGAAQADRVRQTLGGRVEMLARPPDDCHLGEAPIEEGAGLGEVKRAVFEPIQQGGRIDRRQREALRIKAEVGRAIPGTVPGGVDRLVQQAQPEWHVLRQGQQRQGAANRLAPWSDNLQPGGDRQRDA